jgi:hypothetical protein
MGFIFLALFAVTLFVLYIAIRRAWGQTLFNGAIGAILSTVFVMLYALTYEDNSAAQAILAGLVVGLGFSVMVVIIAMFFRSNQPGTDVKLVSRLPQEDISGGQRQDHRQTPK